MNAYGLASALYDMAIHNEDGTVARLDLPLPQTGYYVGGEGAALVFDSVDKVDRGEIAWWIGDNTFADYYGVWVDSATGKVYFDRTTHMRYCASALNVASIRGELAIWDIAGGVEIRVPEVDNG